MATSDSSSSAASSSSSPSSTSPPATTSSSASPTSNTSPTSSSNGSTSPPSSSSQNSSSSSSSNSSAASSQSSSSSSSTSTTSVTPSVTQVVTSSGDTLETITSYITPTVTTTPGSQNASSPNSFFSNKGAVVGVFTVVGVIVVALVIALIVNAVKRHRAQKFDRDVAEAAAEAAASSRSPFEDYSYNQGGHNGGGGGGGAGAGYGYSDNSHGTYTLPPVAPRDTYGISEMSQYDPYASAPAPFAAAAVARNRSRKESEPGAPGIAGVGAGTLAREPSKRAPYHAFAGPTPPPPELQRGNGTIHSIRSTGQDVLEATGLNNGAYVARRPSETTRDTHFSGSGRSQFGSISVHSHHPTTLQPGFPVDTYTMPQRRQSRSSDPFAGFPGAMTSLPQSLPNPHDIALPASPPPGQASTDHLEENTESGSPTARRSEEQRMSYQDDADYSQGNRVLRVANE